MLSNRLFQEMSEMRAVYDLYGRWSERTEDVDRMEQVEADVAYEIAENSNKEEFVVEEPPAIEEKPVPKTVADVPGINVGKIEKEPVGKDMNVSTKEKKQEFAPFMAGIENME